MASGIRTFGIDVSHWNGKVSWDVVLKPDAPVTVHFATGCALMFSWPRSGHGPAVRACQGPMTRIPDFGIDTH